MANSIGIMKIYPPHPVTSLKTNIKYSLYDIFILKLNKMNLPNDQYSLKTTKYDFLNGLINKNNFVKFKIIPNNNKTKKIYRISQEQAQLLSYFILRESNQKLK